MDPLRTKITAEWTQLKSGHCLWLVPYEPMVQRMTGDSTCEGEISKQSADMISRKCGLEMHSRFSDPAAMLRVSCILKITILCI